jgi:Uma2 family endonuclease
LTLAGAADYGRRMGLPAHPTAMTAEELFLISSNDARYELDAGTLVRMPPAGLLHSRIALRIARILLDWVEPRQLGTVLGADAGFILRRHPDVVRAPDVSFIARNRLPTDQTPEQFAAFAPDLAVEVVSPNDWAVDLETKVADYFAAGSRMVWVVHPRTRTVHCYRSLRDVRILGEDDVLDAGDALPGFTCPVVRCFD